MLSEWRGHHMQHRIDDAPLLLEVIRAHRPIVGVELGTDEGGFALFLADTLAEWNAPVYTFDKIERPEVAGALADAQNMTFVRADVLTAVDGLVRSLIAEPGALLYCDNGHKERELELYAPLMGPNALLGVHDYGTEVRPDFAKSLLEDTLGFAPVRHEDFAALSNQWYPNSLTRFWARA